MKLKDIIYLSLFTLMLVNCNKKNLPEKKVLVKSNSFGKVDTALNKIVITGKTDDIVAFKYLNIINNTYLFGKPHKDIKKEIFADSIHFILNSIEAPIIMDLVSAGNKFYRTKAFMIPGDTIHIRIEKGGLKFYGKNAILNNYYLEMNNHTPEYSKNPYLGSINRYKKKVKYIYQKKIYFFNQYIKKHNLQSELFLNTIKTHLKHEYLNALINPKNVKSRIEGLYFGEIDGLMPLIQKEADKNSELIIDLSNYFESISIEEFKDVNALNNSFFFKDNINPYIRYYFLDSKYLAYSKEKFLAEKELIQNNFEGEIENYAIARMIRDYHIKGFGKSINTIDILKNSIDEYEDKFTKPSYIEFMNYIKEDLKTYNFELRESALNSKFININRDTLTLKKVFARSKKRIKVLDFWATWCPPCIKQIKEGKAFKDRLMVENNVEWIYISPEKNYTKWLEKNKEFAQVLNFTNSFYLLKGRKSALSKAFDINSIPRYIIFNKDNKIVLNNAPSPIDYEVFERIIDDMTKEYR